MQFKKPAPDVYVLASNTLNVKPEDCMVIEDSTIGLAAAKAAKMSCIVTKSTVWDPLPSAANQPEPLQNRKPPTFAPCTQACDKQLGPSPRTLQACHSFRLRVKV